MSYRPNTLVSLPRGDDFGSRVIDVFHRRALRQVLEARRLLLTRQHHNPLPSETTGRITLRLRPAQGRM